jgi:UDP-glucose 4-epimerase
VEGIGRVMEEPACFGKVTNLGTDQEISINGLADKVLEVTGSRSLIKHVPFDSVYGPGFEDMQRRVPSLERAAELVGYRPARGLREIIQDVAAALG